MPVANVAIGLAVGCVASPLIACSFCAHRVFSAEDGMNGNKHMVTLWFGSFLDLETQKHVCSIPLGFDS